MKGPDVILGLLEVDTGLAAVGGIDLGHERRGDLHVAHAALVGGGTEAGQVADHSAAQGDDDVLAGEAGARQFGPHDLGVRNRLRALSRHDHHLAAQRRHRVAIQAPDVAVGHQEAPARDRRGPEAGLQQARTDADRVVARRSRGPDQPDPGRHALGRHQHVGHRVRALPGHLDVGQRGIDGLALGVQGIEARAVGRQGAAAALAAPPGRLGIDVDPDHEMAPQRLSDPS